jgi:PPK2 family polyphosphate:nucleotide phosphotransferase
MKTNLDDFRFDGKGQFKIKEANTKVKDLYDDDDDYEVIMAGLRAEMDALQTVMYAHNRYSVLVVLQAMDAAGKDGTLKAVMSGVNPAGVRIVSFKRPSETDLSHDYLWRHTLELPERGNVTVFNRSYYEEVLVVKVHPNILTNVQQLPTELTKNIDKAFQNRYDDIVNYEKYLQNNGTKIIKFFLHVSKQEQGKRLIARIEDPNKNWKFEDGDIKERELWDDYQTAYEDAINATGTTAAPWYIVPADDKKNMRIIVARAINQAMSELAISLPESSPERHTQLQALIETIKKQDAE